jgi:hypothetical protein
MSHQRSDRMPEPFVIGDETTHITGCGRSEEELD